jgi:hypothetical protein
MNTFETKLSAVLLHYLSIHEADAVENMLRDDDYTERDVIEYIEWCDKRYQQDLDTEFDSWLDDRKPRVKIEFFVTSCGHPIHEALEFPKRGEDMENGTEYEWYYSLREVTDQIMALKVGESMNFKLRDDDTSHGTIVRIS